MFQGVRGMRSEPMASINLYALFFYAGSNWKANSRAIVLSARGFYDAFVTTMLRIVVDDKKAAADCHSGFLFSGLHRPCAARPGLACEAGTLIACLKKFPFQPIPLRAAPPWEYVQRL